MENYSFVFFPTAGQFRMRRKFRVVPVYGTQTHW